MNVVLPRQIEERLAPGRASLHLAIGLFADDEATLGQAAEAAGVSQAVFLRELGRRHIPIHYGIEELEEDLHTVAQLAAR